MAFKEKDRVLIPGSVISATEGIVTVALDNEDNEMGGVVGYFKESFLMHEEDLLIIRAQDFQDTEQLQQYQHEYRTKLEVKTNELNDVDAALKNVTGSTRIEKLLSVLEVLRTHKASFQNSMMLEDGQIIYGEHLALMAVRNTIKELDDLKLDFQKGLEEEHAKTLDDIRESISQLLEEKK